jgi:DNA polymerase V
MVYQGIHTAADFAAKSERWVRNHFTVTTLRTWKELNGIPCISLDELPQKKSICTSRSFPERGIADVGALEEAVAAFASLCAKKMREQQSCCQNVTVFAHTSRFATDGPVHVIQKTRSLSVPTQDTSEISSVALNMLRSEIDIYRNSHLAGKDIGERADVMSSPHYKKAGVILWGFVPQNAIQQDLFDHIDRNRQAALVKAIDEINRKNGHDRVRIATEGTDVPFEPDHQYRSRQFTTDINDVLVAQI